MRYYITDQCDNCMKCVEACPTHAIYPAGSMYRFGGEAYAPLSFHTPYVVQEECDGCVYRGAPQCVEACDRNTIYTNMLE
jgi:Fe-S-cluster-containing hydrogenase component 2